MNKTRTNRRHPLVIKTEEILRSLTPDEYGMLRARRASCLNVRASPRSIDRALRIMNRLLRAIENDGHKVMITAEEKPRTIASAGPVDYDYDEQFRHVVEKGLEQALKLSR